MAARTQVLHREVRQNHTRPCDDACIGMLHTPQLQVVPPCGVTHAVAAHLTSPADGDSLPDLVIVRSRLLEVYTPRHEHAHPPPLSNTYNQCNTCHKERYRHRFLDKVGPSSTRLNLIYSRPLWGVAESIAVQPAPASQRDAVLLSFRWVSGGSVQGGGAFPCFCT